MENFLKENMESGININIEESVMDEAEDLITPEDDDVTDVIHNNGIFPAPVSAVSAGVDFLNFNGFTEAFSRRGSLRSSITSIDSGSGIRDRFEFICTWHTLAYAGKRKFCCCQKQIVVKQAQIHISANRGDISTNRCGPVCAALYLGS